MKRSVTQPSPASFLSFLEYQLLANDEMAEPPKPALAYMPKCSASVDAPRLARAGSQKPAAVSALRITNVITPAIWLRQSGSWWRRR